MKSISDLWDKYEAVYYMNWKLQKERRERGRTEKKYFKK